MKAESHRDSHWKGNFEKTCESGSASHSTALRRSLMSEITVALTKFVAFGMMRIDC